jgi:hypothetical protein
MTLSLLYSQLRDELQTGDIVLFSGKGPISAGIKWFTHSTWSHVGLVIRLPMFDSVLLWESTTLSDLVDLDSGVLRQGVQLVSLSDRLARYDGPVRIRRLQHIKLNASHWEALAKLRREVTGRPYEQSRLELLRSAYDGFGGLNREDLSSLFCSELVAEAYQRMGLLSEEQPSNEFTPKDFTEARGLQLMRGALGPEIEVLR